MGEGRGGGGERVAGEWKGGGAFHLRTEREKKSKLAEARGPPCRGRQGGRGGGLV